MSYDDDRLEDQEPEPERCATCERPANYIRLRGADRIPWCGSCEPDLDRRPRPPRRLGPIAAARLRFVELDPTLKAHVAAASAAVDAFVEAAARRRAWQREHLATWRTALAVARYERVAAATGDHGPMPTLSLMGGSSEAPYDREIAYLRAAFVDERAPLDRRFREWTWPSEISIDHELEQLLEEGPP